MNPLEMVLVGLGVVLSLLGMIWFLVVTFRESVFWGLGCLLFSPLALLFLLVHWEDASGPFFTSLTGTLLIWLATGVTPV